MEARERALYGEHLADVQYLRWRGFIIDRHEIHPASQAVRVGSNVVTFADLHAKADRERRLEEFAKRTIEAPKGRAGRKPGTMSLAEKAAKAAAARRQWRARRRAARAEARV